MGLLKHFECYFKVNNYNMNLLPQMMLQHLWLSAVRYNIPFTCTFGGLPILGTPNKEQ